MRKIFLSIVIPVYNEMDRLHHLKEVIDYLNKQRYTSEIIIVNDGSVDGTLNRLNKLNVHNRYHIISYPGRRGKGFAVKTGMLSAKGNLRLFTDIDLSTPIDEIGKFLPYIHRFDVIIGSRKKRRAKVLIHQSKLRESLGRGFTFLSGRLLRVRISDFTCGFKIFSKRASEKIFNKTKIERWGFDSEILYLAQKYKFKIKEIPVTWADDVKTRVKFPQDLIRSFLELIEIILNDRYRKIY